VPRVEARNKEIIALDHGCDRRLDTPLRKTSRYLLTTSFLGLAVFAPFSISGSNISIVIGFLGAAVGFVADARVRDRYRLILRDPLARAALLLVVSAVPAVFISEDLSRGFSEWKAYWNLLLYLLLAYNLISDRLRRLVFWVFFTSMTLSSIVALIQHSGGLNLGLFRIASDTYRPGGTLYNMTFAGILYQAITVNFAVGLGGRWRSRRTVIVFAGLALQLLALLFTLTRGAWLALIGGLFTVPLILKRRAVFLAGVAIMVVAGGIMLQNDTLRNRASSVIKSLHGPADRNVSTRETLWDISWELFRRHPFVGVGLGDYTIEADKLLRERDVTTTVDSHNIYLQVLATRGLVGFIPFVIFWIVLIRGLFSERRALARNSFAAYFIAGVIGATVAVLIGALSENNLDDEEVFTAFMLFVGMAKSFALWCSPQERRAVKGPGDRP
jgi:O-antigen ligase